MAMDIELIWNQILALLLNLKIWFLRQVLCRPPPPLFQAGSRGLAPAALGQPPESPAKLAQRAKATAESADACVCVEIVGPGGSDQLQGSMGSWAVCGYNLMKEFGGQRIPTPLAVLPPDLVLVRNKAFSVNYADICIRWGLYESALRFVGWPIVPGFDVAGTVEAAGHESGFSVGDQVFGCSFFGGYSTRVLVPRRQLLQMPPGLSFEAAAALPAVAATALHAVHLAGAWPSEILGRGRDALVHSAAGGVGDMLCQVLRLCGLRVVGVVGSKAKISSCKADAVIDKSHEDWVTAARRHAPNGYRAVFDANGVASLKASYGLLGRNGRLVVYGFHSNLPKCDGGLGMLSPLSWLRMSWDLLRTPHFDPMFLTLDSKAVLGFNLSFFAEETEQCERYLAQVGSWISSGKIKAPPVKTYGLDGIREAHTELTSGRSVGKLVVSL